MDPGTATAPAPVSTSEGAAPASSPKTERGGKDSLFGPRSKRTKRNKWVTLEDGREYYVAALEPIENAWVTQQCLREVPDPNSTTGETIREFYGLKRGLLQVTIALREPDGKRMFGGNVEDPGEWWIGEDLVAHMDNVDYEKLLTAVAEVNGGIRAKAVSEAGKSSGATRTEPGLSVSR